MAVKRMDHVGVVVNDLDAAIEFFVALGLEAGGKGQVEGAWVDRIIGVEGARSELAFVQTPDGHNRLELTRFLSPETPTGDPQAPSNAPGIRHLTFAVEDLDDVVARLETHGAKLVGTIEQYEDSYRLCYIRGPEGIIIELAEELD
jgi:catechol 2,3-dioxygenase-like lactoylglutathione lyase family enzyme